MRLNARGYPFNVLKTWFLSISYGTRDYLIWKKYSNSMPSPQCQNILAFQGGKRIINNRERRSENSPFDYFKIRANPILKRLQFQKVFHTMYTTHLMRSNDSFMKNLFLQFGSPRICYLKDRNLSNMLVKPKHKLKYYNVNQSLPYHGVSFPPRATVLFSISWITLEWYWSFDQPLCCKPLWYYSKPMTLTSFLSITTLS